MRIDYAEIFDQVLDAEMRAREFAIKLDDKLDDFEAFAMPAFLPMPLDAVCAIYVVPRRFEDGE